MHHIFTILTILASVFALPMPNAPQAIRSIDRPATMNAPLTLLDKRQEDEDLEMGGTPFSPRQVDPDLEYGGTPFDKRQESDEDIEHGGTPFSPRQVDPDLEYGGTPFDKRQTDEEDLESASPFDDITS